MSKNKTERLMNLMIALLSSRRFVTRAQLREAIYGDGDDAAFERQFERDKEELRALGVPIKTGGNDRLFDDEQGYRIARDDFELPPITFDADELAVLGVAANAWQQGVASEATTAAIVKLRAAGIEPDAERLTALAPHVGASEEAFEPLWDALAARRRVRFDYHGEAREVDPWSLVSRHGAWYLIGFDKGRGAPRCYKLARFESAPRAVGGVDAFVPPAREELRVHVASLRPQTPSRHAVVAIAEGAAPELRRRGEPCEMAVPDGYVAYDVMYGTDAELVAEVCAAGIDALLIEPASLRDQVIARMRHVVGEAS